MSYSNNYHEDERRYEMEQRRETYEYELHLQDQENQMRYAAHLMEMKHAEIREIVSLIDLIFKHLLK
jgi:hypothetical protein